MTPEYQWGADLRSLLWICNASTTWQIPDTWRTVALLEKDRARAAMEAACRHTAESLRFRPPHISYAVGVMVMVLTFHTKDPDGVGDALNILLFPDLSPSAGLEAAVLTRKWGAIFGGGTLTYFADTSLLI